MLGRQSDPSDARRASGWTSGQGSASSRRRPGRRLGSVLLLIPLLIGLVGAPVAPTANGDELSDARARQAALKQEAADQAAAIAKLTELQTGLADQIRQTNTQLKGINADLVAVKTKIGAMQSQIAQVKSAYAALVAKLADLQAQLLDIQGQEGQKKVDLATRKALLAQRVRAAYDTDRTSLLEAFLSGGTFADLLTEMGYYIDIGEQDKALAIQIVKDQDTLAALHQTVVDTQNQTEDLRMATAAQKKVLDQSLADLKTAQATLKKLEKATAAALSRQKAAYRSIAKNKADAQKALAKAAAAQKALQAQITEIIRKQSNGGRIPSEYNGTLNWPMAGDVTQNFGCTGFSWEPPFGACDHYHNGIDIVAPYGTPVKASGDGTVVYIGWNYADGADPAWIVIIAHSQGLQTWYAHMQARYPGGIGQGSQVSAGQVIGYEGNTGHSTGAHLHWGVMLNGDFVNPRLFL